MRAKARWPRSKYFTVLRPRKEIQTVACKARCGQIIVGGCKKRLTSGAAGTDEHRDAATVGFVSVWTKLSRQKTLFGARFHPQTDGYKHCAQKCQYRCLGSCCRQ